MKLSDCIADYLNHIRHERGLAKATCEGYTSWLHTFSDWLEANGYPDADLSAFSVSVLRRYQYARSRAGIRPRTILSTFAGLRGMGEYLVANGALDSNPVKSLTLPRKDAAVRLEVTTDDVRALLAACERQRRARDTALFRAVLSVLIYGGLRRAECAGLLVTDINTAERSILVRSGKGAKSRKVYVCAEAIENIHEWLIVRETSCVLPNLFTWDIAKPLNDEGVGVVIEHLKSAAGLRGNEAIKPHGLRHWAATNLLRNGANLRDVQSYLGHSSVTVTAMYLHSSEEQLRSISGLTALNPAPQSKPAGAGNVIRLPRAVRQEEDDRGRARRRLTRIAS